MWNQRSWLTCKLLMPSDDDPCNDLEPRWSFSEFFSRSNLFRILGGWIDDADDELDDWMVWDPFFKVWRGFLGLRMTSLCLRSKFLSESVELWPEFEADDKEARGMCHDLWLSICESKLKIKNAELIKFRRFSRKQISFVCNSDHQFHLFKNSRLISWLI